MEGISIGESEGKWFLSLNLSVLSSDEVIGWHYTSDFDYEWEPDMRLLDGEVWLGPKCLIKW